MTFRETLLAGAYVIEPERSADPRGYFARFFCAREFEQRGLLPRIAQCSVAYNESRGTLRGLHYQASPHQEAKTVRCLQGAIYDVIVDLREGSPTRHRWYGLELTAREGTVLFVPPGFAHGYVTLEDRAEVEYLISEIYVPQAARGIRYDDPTLGISWPIQPGILSDRDRALPLLSEVGHV